MGLILLFVVILERRKPSYSQICTCIIDIQQTDQDLIVSSIRIDCKLRSGFDSKLRSGLIVSSDLDLIVSLIRI